MVAILLAFPPVYAVIVRSMALPIAIFIAALLLRAIGIEIHIRSSSRNLDVFLDVLIVVGSFIPVLSIGFFGANILEGLAIDAKGVMQGSALSLLNPFSILTALLSGAVFALQGSLFLGLRTTGDFRSQIEGWAKTLLTMLMVLIVAGFFWSRTVLRMRYATSLAMPFFWISLVLGLGAYASVWVNVRFERRVPAFVGSCVGMAAIAVCSAALLFPMIVPSTLEPSFGLTVGKAAADDASLRMFLVDAAVALPLVLLYVFVSYRSIGRRRKDRDTI